MNVKQFFISLISGALGTLFVLGGFVTLVYFNQGKSLNIAQNLLNLHNTSTSTAPQKIENLFSTMSDASLLTSSNKKAAFSGFGNTAGTPKLTVAEMVKIANPAVVNVIITQDVPKYELVPGSNQSIPNGFDPFGFFQQFSIPSYRQNGTEKKTVGGGSGFLVSSDGYIITNRYVINMDNAEFTVELSNGKKYPARVIAKDKVLDVGVLKITGSNFPYLPIGNSDDLELGQQVVAIGNALAEFQNTVSQGIISGLGRSITAGDGRGGSELLDKVIQTDAAINPGNSGGPLLNMYGEVIGVNVATAQNGQNIGFALPINSVKSIISSVLKTGNIVRPYLGIRYVAVTPEIAKQNNLPNDYGVIIRPGQNKNEPGVIPGSPAEKAGLKENDIILKIDGVPLESDASLSLLVRGKKVGEKVLLEVLSSGQKKQISVLLAAAEE